MTFIGQHAPVNFKGPEDERSRKVAGTHEGSLTPEARAKHRIKDSRSRVSALHPVSALDVFSPGSNKRIHTRLFVKGNRSKRGR